MITEKLNNSVTADKFNSSARYIYIYKGCLNSLLLLLFFVPQNITIQLASSKNYETKDGWKIVKAAVTINVSEANGANETGIWQSKNWQFFILSIHLSTWTLKQATFLFFAASSLEVRSARKLMTEHTTYQEQNKTKLHFNAKKFCT